jgi:hypothetical protein
MLLSGVAVTGTLTVKVALLVTGVPAPLTMTV